MRPRTSSRLTTACAIALVATCPACSSGAPSDAAVDDTAVDAGVDGGPPIEYPMPEAANAVPPSDPRWLGQYRWLYDSFGAEQLDQWPPADFMLDLMTSEPDVFGDQFASFGFIRDPNDEFPVGFKRGLVDPTRVNETCAVCHTARLPDGRLWFGAPATELQLERFILEVDRRWVAAGHPTRLTEREITQLSMQGPGRIDATLGASTTVPVDFPTYYNLAERPYLNVIGTSRDLRSEAYLAVYSLGPGNPDDATALVPYPSDATLAPFVEFLGGFDPPPAPPGDAALIAQGRTVFGAAHCDTCHHVDDISQNGITPYFAEVPDHFPGEDPLYPRGSIRTDPLHYGLETSPLGGGDGGVDGGDAGTGFDENLLMYIRFIGRHRLSIAMTDGYRVTDLRGLAYSAPYLHNGTVPTLEALLSPASERPVTWMRGGFLVDTTTPGNSNAGHEFGTALSDTDRSALIAFLVSL